MAELKTQQNDADVAAYINSIENESHKLDCSELHILFEKVSGQRPKMWGKDIVGFGTYHYKGKSGREGEWFPLGFSSRKANLTIYMPAGFKETQDLIDKIGKCKTSAGCLYIKSLKLIDKEILKELATRSYLKMTGNVS